MHRRAPRTLARAVALSIVLCLALVPHRALAGWTANGAVIVKVPTNQRSPVLAPDGAGGAIIVWTEGPLVAMRIDANCDLDPSWPARGITISPGSGTLDPYMVSDDQGG